MAQHDYVIANQGFPAFRSDLNDALAAVVSNNSGATEPTTMFAHQIWVDTAADPSILKIRNADNDAWITVGVLDQTGDTFILRPAAGSASVPAYSTTSDTNTGVYFPGADRVGITTGGTQRVEVDASGNVGIGTSSPKLNGNAGTFLSVIGTNASGWLEVGTTSQTDGTGGSLTFNNTNIAGSDKRVAQIGAVRAGADNTAYLSFTTNNAGTLAERMRIDSSGRLLVGTTGLTNNGTRMSVSGANRVVRILGSTEGEGAFMIDKTTNTSTTSQVFIQFSINDQATASGQINANGASQAAFGSFSDQRLKENIVDLPPQLANICALRPVEFDYIESEGGGHQIGFVAQNVQEIYPDLVGERSDGMLTLSGLNKNEARLVKAIQELKAELDAVKAELATLKG